jgi:phosphatidylserine/phosphatidylglycerophosphate/cardiolipin synthase-like enzyme
VAPDVRVDVRDVALGIALTEPLYAGRPGVQQIRALYVDAIAAARHNIYIENQYLTAAAVRNALTARLAERDGPDIVAVVPRSHKGWLQAATMGVLRARLHSTLVAADRDRRYRMLCPHVEGLASGCLNVHSKLMIVDDTLLCI